MSTSKPQHFSSSMARVFSIGSLRGGGSHSSSEGPGLARQNSSSSPSGVKEKADEDIAKKGYLKKYKNQKSRYFVLRCPKSSPCPATLSCYDSESKFLDNVQPKRHYLLNQSTHVEPKVDSKRAFAFSIHIKNETLNLVAASEDEKNDWISALQKIAGTSDWEHVWHVEVQNRGLGGSNGGVKAGHAYLCLTNRSLSIVSMDESMYKTDIALNTIRMVAFNNMFFYLEMGRMASTGSGRLWLTTQDNNIAANIYSVVGRVMTNLSITMGMAPPASSSSSSTPSSTPRDRTVSMSATQASNYMTRDRSGSLPSRPNSALRPLSHACGCRPLCGHTSISSGHTCATGHGNVCGSSTTEAHSPGLQQHHCCHHPLQFGDLNRGPASVESVGNQLATFQEDSYVRMDSSSFNEAQEFPGSLDSIPTSRSDSSNSKIPEENYMDMRGDLPSPSDNSEWPTSDRCPQHSDFHHHHHHHHHCHQLHHLPLQGADPHPLHYNTHQYTNNTAAILAANRERAAQTPVSPSPEGDTGSYLNMSLAKPIPTSAVDETSPGSASSSYTSGAGTPSSDHRQEHSSSCSLHHQEKQLLQCYQELAATGSVAMTSSNLSMETDSVPDVEESVDDILDGGSQEDERSARLRLDSLDHCGDDLDMDMEDQDQVDGTTPSSSVGMLDPASAKPCLDVPASSTIAMNVPGVNTRLSSGCPGLLSSSVPAPYPLQHHHHLHHSLPHHHDDDYVLGLEKPIRTSSVGSKPDFVRRKNSTPMLGVSCASRSWSDTSGSYFRNLFSSRSQDKQKDSLMLVDFSKNKSYDQIANSDEGKDKKSLSIERIRSTFAKHRSSTRGKKRVSEGDAITIGSGSFRGGGIEIPSVHNDYFQMDFNPSPRSNNSNHSNTSTNSDVPHSGYLPMRPGASLSFSSTGSTDYVDMSTKTSIVGSGAGLASSTAPADSGYLEMASPRKPLDVLAPSPSAPGDGYVDMTQGSGGLSISVESTSSGSFNVKPRKISNSFSHMSSMELPSPQEDGREFFYLHEVDNKNSQKERKKNRRKSGKESSKRKKSDPNAGESLTETLRNRGSSHLASFSSFLSRKNSQNSSTKTPLSPTGSPLPKSSRNSSSPFPSLGRSKSKEARETSNPAISQSPSSCLSNAPGSLSFLPCMPSINSQLSANNVLGFMHSTLNPSFRDCDTMENENYWTVDAQSSSGCSGVTSMPRNLSNRELGSNCSCCDVKSVHRSSGAFDVHSTCEHNSRPACSNSSCFGNQLSSFSETENAHLKERGTSPPDSHNVYVNFALGNDRSNSSSGVSLRSTSCNCLCNRLSCSRLVPSEKLSQIDNSLVSLKNAKSQSELGRLSESSMEDSNSKSSPVSSTAQEAQNNSSYVNMCPSSNERKSLILPSCYTKATIEKPAAVEPSEERKILNTDPVSCNSSVSPASDYLEMDLRKHDTNSMACNNCSCGSSSCAASPSESHETSVSTSKSAVVQRPALPQALVEMRAEPSVPLEQLTLTDATSVRVSEIQPSAYESESNVSNISPAPKTGAVSIPSTEDSDGAGCSGSYTERFRSHSGPGAPESHNGKDVGLEVTDETPRRGSEGETRALSACSSPMSYSPPTSPNLASSSKSSLSEGGMSSASSTCTVVNVGLRLQQQQHANRKSHGSGSSTSTNTDSCSGTTPSPLNCSIISVPSVSLSATRIKSSSAEQSGGSSVPRQQACVPHIEGIASHRSKDNVVYACLDLAPPRSDAVLSGDSNQRQRHNSCQAHSSPVVSSELTASSSLSESIVPNRNSCDLSKATSTTTSKLASTNKMAASTSDAAASLSYTEIDFKKSEGLRTACLAARDTLRH